MLDAFDDLRLRELVLLDRVVQLGTITAAARELGLPKPTAGRWLAALEERAHGPLLVRGARRATLTERGEAFHRQAQRVLAAARALQAVATRDELGGTLRVSVPVPLGRLVGGDVVAAFHRRFPAVRLEVRLENRRVDLVQDRVDLAIRGGPLPDSELIARRLAVVALWLYGRPEADPGDQPLVAAPGDEALLAPHWPALGPAAVVVDDRTAVRDALLAGTGVGLLPGFLGEGPRARGELARFGDQPLSRTPVHAVWLPEQRGDLRLRTLVELIEAAVRGLASSAD